MIVEIPVYHHPDGSRTIGQPDPHHGVMLGGIAMALNGRNSTPVASCDCLSCQTGRPDYPCLIEENDL
ncbi:MAG: hypothetical protein ABIV36_11000 [Sphingobium limneticum]